MADSNVSALAVFDNGAELNYLEKDGEILFTAGEIGKHLGYSDPVRAVSKLYSRNKNELKLYTTVAKLTTGEQNQSVNYRLFTEEGAYILSMLARTNQAKKFRARVALLLRRVRQETMQRQIELARTQALKEGMALSRRLTAERKTAIRRALAYRNKGLTCREIGKLMDCRHQTVSRLLRDAALAGQEAQHA